MKLELLYHPNSPFTQKVWMWAIEKGVASQIKLRKVVVCPVPYPGWSDNNEDVGAWNPIAKIPTLIIDLEDGSEKFSVHDSKIICDFLVSIPPSSGSKQFGGGNKVDSMKWKRESLHRAADGMQDCEVLLVYEDRIRKPLGLYDETWVEGQRLKIRRGLKLLEESIKDGTLRYRDGDAAGDAVGAEECAVAAALALCDSRNVEWRNGREDLRKWYEGWAKRASFKQSRPTVDWRRDAAQSMKM